MRFSTTLLPGVFVAEITQYSNPFRKNQTIRKILHIKIPNFVNIVQNANFLSAQGDDLWEGRLAAS